MINVTAIVPAAGAGTRLGAGQPKALVKLAGEPLIARTCESLKAAGVQQIIVTAPPDDPSVQQNFRSVLAPYAGDVHVVPGGHTRQESVSLGLAAARALWPTTTHVLIHDAARALTPPDMIMRILSMLFAGAPAVIPVIPVVDTVKQVVSERESSLPFRDRAQENPNKDSEYTELIEATLDRARLRAVQTPQAFEISLIERAHESGAKMSAEEKTAAPDDAALIEQLGEPVRTVPGDRRAFKITTPFDLAFAQWLVECG